MKRVTASYIDGNKEFIGRKLKLLVPIEESGFEVGEIVECYKLSSLGDMVLKSTTSGKLGYAYSDSDPIETELWEVVE